MASLLNLSNEDHALFKSLQGSCLFPSLAVPGSGEMVNLYKTKKREEERKFIEPYADLLEDELVKMLKRRKAIIYEELLNSKDTSFTVELFSWKTVSYHEPIWVLNERVSKMTCDEELIHDLREWDRKSSIKSNEWETMFGTQMGSSEADELDWIHSPVKVDRIFRHSDLGMRLSLALGPNFLPHEKWESIFYMDGLPGVGNGYTVYKKTLYVSYHPFGINKRQLKNILEVARKERERLEKGQRATLGPAEYPVGHSALNILK